jgi:hypothetical protein
MVNPIDVKMGLTTTTTRMIVDYCYRYVPAPDDGAKLENAWKSTRILPELERAELQGFEMMMK